MSTHKKPPIAILSIRNSYQYGGSLSCLQAVYQFCKRYFEPHVFCVGFDNDIATSIRRLRFSSGVKEIAYFGMPTTVIGARWAAWEPGHYAYTKEVWADALKHYEYVFVVSGTPIAGHPAVLLDKKFVLWAGTPYHDDRAVRAAQLRGLYAYLDRKAQPAMEQIQRTVLTSAGAVMAISSYAGRSFAQVAPACTDKLMVCPFPFALPEMHTSPLQKEKIILAVGRFSDPRKNVAMLLRVFDRLYQQDPQVRLLVVGKAPDHHQLGGFITLDSFKQVTFTGQVSAVDLKNLYQAAQLFLLTSYQEGLGIVGVEALANGVPVVATDCGGTTDYVLHDQTGYLVAVNDDRAMAYYALQILQDNKLATRLGSAGRKLIKERYAQEAVENSFKLALIKTYPELADHFVQEQDLQILPMHCQAPTQRECL